MTKELKLRDYNSFKTDFILTFHFIQEIKILLISLL
jgi:hypothetical protein